MRKVRTDNTHLSYKIELRKEAIKDLDKIKVLDLYGGENAIWKNIGYDTYYGIEIKPDKGVNVTGDNLRIIPSLDLSKYNVIDCDSYGLPYAQIKKLFQNPTLKPNTIIIYTGITSVMRANQKDMLDDFNVPEWFPNGLISNMSIDAFFHMLKKNKVNSITGYKIKDKGQIKMYGFFKYTPQ